MATENRMKQRKSKLEKEMAPYVAKTDAARAEWRHAIENGKSDYSLTDKFFKKFQAAQMRYAKALQVKMKTPDKYFQCCKDETC